VSIQDYYAQAIAFNANTGDLVTGAVFTVHLPDDGTFANPLPVSEPVSGAAIPQLRSNSVGVLPDFAVAGAPPQVVIRSGSFATKLTSVYGAVLEAGLDPQTVATAITAAATATTARDAAVAAAADAQAATAPEIIPDPNREGFFIIVKPGAIVEDPDREGVFKIMGGGA
jgi:hypothetical protein